MYIYICIILSFDEHFVCFHFSMSKYCCAAPHSILMYSCNLAVHVYTYIFMYFLISLSKKLAKTHTMTQKALYATPIKSKTDPLLLRPCPLKSECGRFASFTRPPRLLLIIMFTVGGKPPISRDRERRSWRAKKISLVAVCSDNLQRTGSRR